MKKAILLLWFLAVQTVLSAQGYFPEGTKWTEIRLDTLKYDSWYSKVGDDWVPNFETIEYRVGEEYKDRDMTYRKVFTSGPAWTDSLALLIQEKDDCVLVSAIVSDYDGKANVLWPAEAYQFDWSIGKGVYFEDLLSCNTTTAYPYYFYYGVIDDIKEESFGGVRPLRYADLDGKAPADSQNPGNTDTRGGRIIQGIGVTEWNGGECLFGPPNPYGALSMYESYQPEFYPERHYRSMLVRFERGGELLYNIWPGEGPTVAIEATREEYRPTGSTFYDFQGRHLDSTPRKGIYIQQGKKYVK